MLLFSKSQRYYYDYVAVMEPVTGNAHSRGNGIGPKTGDRDTAGANNVSFQTSVTDTVMARNRRDVWTIASEPLNEAHYAAYPQALVEPCILAGSSAHGVCAACGSPYRRKVERQFYGDCHTDQDLKDQGVHRFSKSKWREMEKQSSGHRMVDRIQNSRDAGADHDVPFLPPKTLGWLKSCKCETQDLAKAIILDPFLGSGTTARVAERLNRRWIGLDLGYQEMQARRLRDIQRQLIPMEVG